MNALSTILSRYTTIPADLRAQLSAELSGMERDAASWRRLGLCYEDELPEDMSDSAYRTWYHDSQIIYGVRMGPILAAMTKGK